MFTFYDECFYCQPGAKAIIPAGIDLVIVGADDEPAGEMTTLRDALGVVRDAQDDGYLVLWVEEFGSYVAVLDGPDVLALRPAEPEEG